MRAPFLPHARRGRQLAYAVLMAACGRDATPIIDRAHDAARAEDANELDAPPADARAWFEDVCRPDGQYAFGVSTSGLDPWDGEHVVVAAVERNLAVVTRVALLNETIARGGFSVGCPSALRTNTQFSSIAAYVDLDRSGGCSTADVAYLQQRFGWDYDVVIDLPAGTEAWVSVAAGLSGPNGDDFCAGYFE